MQDTATEYVVLGHVSKSHGVQGWVNVVSYTQPIENILQYHPWYLKLKNSWQVTKVVKQRASAKSILVQFESCTDRNQADVYHGAEIAVMREQLPNLVNENDHYWNDLLGLTVITTEGVELGKVNNIFATGSNDVLVVQGERERMLPYLLDEVVKKIDLNSKQMIVDWDPDF